MTASVAGRGRLAVTLDGTPLLGRRTGIGRYTEHLLTALAGRPDLEVAATAFTLRGWRGLAGAVPPGVAARARPAPARALRAAWTHGEWPPVSLLAGRSDVFHGTNFVLPPTGRAGGVVTVHDLTFLTMPDTVDATSLALRDLVPRSLRRAAAVCTPTETVAGQLADAYGPILPDVVVTPLGVDERWFAAGPAAGDGSGPDASGMADDRNAGHARVRDRLRLPERYLLFVGTREPRKDLRTLLAAYRSLKAESPGAPELMLIGPDGWGEAETPPPGARVLGYLDQQDLPAVVGGALALVMPSRDEGFGLPVLEALATGTEVVISDIPVLREVAGGFGRPFPVGDADALAAVLASVVEHGPGTPTERAARRAAAARRTWAACAERTVDAYRAAAG